MNIIRKISRKIIQQEEMQNEALPLLPKSVNNLCAKKRKILVLDLDETLIHTLFTGGQTPTGTTADFIISYTTDNYPVTFFVHKRPHVDTFLDVVSQWYELVVYTAGTEMYGSAVADKLDTNRNILKRRYYRQHCTLNGDTYVKDLSVVHDDMSSIVTVDNSPNVYCRHPDNVIPIKSWFNNPNDTELLNLLPLLNELRFDVDVRVILRRNL